MRYHLDTIPVWDAVKLDSECVLCELRAKAEAGQIDHYLGDSVMEPDTRIRVNEHGFCAKHHGMLYAQGNRLGHALMLSTHMAETEKKLDRQLAALRKQAEAYSASSLAEKLTGKAREATKGLAAGARELQAMAEDCVVCAGIREDMRRWLHTFFHLYHTDAEFRKRIAESKGVCLPDAALLIETAPEELPAKEVGPFVAVVTDILDKNLRRTEEDVNWLIRKYDYRFDNEPWKNAKDSVERACNKLCGKCVK